MSKRKTFCIVVPSDISDEEINALKDRAEKAYGLDSNIDIVRGSNNDNGIVARVVIENDLTAQHQGYIPMERPNKKELRTSPYAKFGKFHKNRRK